MAFIPTLYTPRLTLRPFALSDALRVHELAGDARVASTAAQIPHPYPDGLAQQWIMSHEPQAQDGVQFHFAITLAGTRTPGREADLSDTGHLIGAISLVLASDPQQHRAELSYWIGAPYWNHGFATEAAHAALAFGFQRKALQRIVARHSAGNPASGRVLLKLGMTHEGTLQDGFASGDQLQNLECYALQKDVWLRTRLRHRFPAAARSMQPV